jgi:hypothetical protein
MNDRALIRTFETGRGRRIAILAVAVMVFAIVIAAVVTGFHGVRVRRSASALTRPAVPAATQPLN